MWIEIMRRQLRGELPDGTPASVDDEEGGPPEATAEYITESSKEPLTVEDPRSGPPGGPGYPRA
jgi:hypothetical protein